MRDGLAYRLDVKDYEVNRLVTDLALGAAVFTGAAVFATIGITASVLLVPTAGLARYLASKLYTSPAERVKRDNGPY